jgi:hypothetical protein
MQPEQPGWNGTHELQEAGHPLDSCKYNNVCMYLALNTNKLEWLPDFSRRRKPKLGKYTKMAIKI